MESLARFVKGITDVKDNFLSFVGDQLSNIQHSGANLLDSTLSAFGYK